MWVRHLHIESSPRAFTFSNYSLPLTYLCNYTHGLVGSVCNVMERVWLITSHLILTCWKTESQFDWGFWYVIIFLCVQFWIRLAAVSYRGKKVRTVASPAVRSVNKSRDTRNCVQNEPEYAFCVIFTTCLYYKTLGLILCDQIWQIIYKYNRLDDGHCDVTGHRKTSVLWWQPIKNL